jgi:hypothetical protein
VRYTYKGMAAGLFAASVAAVVLKLNAQTGLLPAVDPIGAAGVLTGTGAVGGWIAFLILGAGVGALFAWLDPDLPGDSLRQRGMILSSLIWAAMALFVMPLAGLGLFGLEHGLTLALAILALHLLFGAVLGGTYGWLLLQSAPLRYRHARAQAPAVRRSR